MHLTTTSARAANRFRHAVIVLPLVLLLPLWSSGKEKPAAKPVPKITQPVPEASTLYIRFTDDRIVKFAMGKEDIRLTTPYGKLVIPVASVRSIDFATRIPEADARRAKAAVANLASQRYRVRRAAEAELLKLREKASPALHQALRSGDVEVIMRARAVLNKLSQIVAEDLLEVRTQDVVRTSESRIAGRIEGTALKAYPLPPDKGQGKMLPLTGLHSLAVGTDPRSMHAVPDPGNLQAFQAQIGKTFWFKVTGAVTGTIWGTKVYTSDSPLGTTAVHAGILKPGQKGVVRVKIVAPPASYAGSNQNGVTSSPYGIWPGAYQFIR